MKLSKRLNHLVKTGCIVVFLASGPDLSAQPLDLQTCYQKAGQLSPLRQQEAYLASIHQLNQRIESSKFLPDMTLKGTASYQSDVFNLPFEMPGANIPVIPKDQYQFTFNLTQNVYDGGLVSASKKLKEADVAVRQQQLKVSLYEVRSMIDELYFGILSLQANEKIILGFTTELRNQEKKARSGIENGIMLPDVLKSLKKEELRARQQLDAIRIRRNALSQVLRDWVGMEISGETMLAVPQVEVETEQLARPELALFESRMQQLQANKGLLEGALRPKVAAFANVGYGSPNTLNFFETDWNTYYIIGGRITWKFWDWNINKRQRQVLNLNQEIIRAEQENFEKNLNNQMTRQLAEIALIRQSIATDRQLLLLQEEITKSSARQFELGTVTATDYLTELNNLIHSRLQLELHQVQLAKAQITFQTLSGNKP